jgi:hypothetical protein
MRVAGAKRWLIRLAVLATGVALIATSPPPSYEDVYEREVTGPSVELSASKPRARFVITVRTTEQAPVVGDALATVYGTLTGSPTASFVEVQFSGDPAGSAANELSALTGFQLSRSLAFTGNCQQFDSASPCETTLELNFERAAGAEPTAVTRIDWSLALESRIAKDDGPSKNSLALPWAVGIDEE